MGTNHDAARRLRTFYAGKTILVTGHTGFKGAWLSLWLGRLGARVVGLSLPAEGDGSRALFQPEVAASRALDLRDLQGVTDAVREHSPEIVFHLAAQSLVTRSSEDPTGTFATNVMGTVHVLEAACRTQQTRVVVNVTSDKCYANPGPARPFREDDPLGGKDAYSASKACSEIVTAAWRQSLRSGDAPAIATVRAGNVIGGGDYASNRIVPDIVRAIMSNQPVVLRHPSSTRPWQHVLEPLYGYLLLAQALHDDLKYEGAWNFGPDPSEVRQVRRLACRIFECWGKGSALEAQGASGVHEASDLKLDSSKSKRQLNWHPTIGVDDAVDLTVDWYRRVLERGEDPIAVTEWQIAAGEARLGQNNPRSTQSIASAIKP